MELIRTVMLNVIAIVFFTTLLDALLPDGSMRSYLKMAMGFFVVLTFLQPVMQLLQPDGMLQQWQLEENGHLRLEITRPGSEKNHRIFSADVQFGADIL